MASTVDDRMVTADQHSSSADFASQDPLHLFKSMFVVSTLIFSQPDTADSVLESLSNWVSSACPSSAGLSGYVVFTGGRFFHLIEGDSQKVDEYFTHLCSDHRVCTVHLIRLHRDSHREFPDGTLHFTNLDKSDNSENDNTLSGEFLLKAIRTILLDFADLNSMLDHYTQPAIRTLVKKGLNPVTTPATIRRRVILFTDIISFSTLSEKMDVHEIVHLVNTYFTLVTRIVNAFGGHVTKYIGDCVMSYFEDGDEGAKKAVKAGFEILQATAVLRKKFVQTSSVLQVLYGGVGIAEGFVIESNIGCDSCEKESNRWLDYTIMGDTVNQASRIEGMTRFLPRLLLFSGNVRKHITSENVNLKPSQPIISMGSFQLKGRAEQVELFSIEDECTDRAGIDPISRIQEFLIKSDSSSQSTCPPATSQDTDHGQYDQVQDAQQEREFEHAIMYRED